MSPNNDDELNTTMSAAALKLAAQIMRINVP
jgi:hypothetical protein